MKFTKALPNPFYDNYGYSDRLESETGKWTICLAPMLYGIRVMAGITNSHSFALSVCAGADKSDIFVVYCIVQVWLSQFSESAAEGEVNRKFPVFPIKPVMQNPNWDDFVETVLKKDDEKINIRSSPRSC